MEIMMAGRFARMILDGTKTQTRRVGLRWSRVKVGDVLHVREAYALVAGRCWYRADEDASGVRWTPAVHMPLSLCRCKIRVTSVRQERADAISEADALAEGMGALAIDGLLDLAGGSKRKCARAFRALGPGYLRVREWETLESDWAVLTAAERFQVVMGVLGAQADAHVTVIEFEKGEPWRG